MVTLTKQIAFMLHVLVVATVRTMYKPLLYSSKCPILWTYCRRGHDGNSIIASSL